MEMYISIVLALLTVVTIVSVIGYALALKNEIESLKAVQREYISNYWKMRNDVDKIQGK